MEREFDYGADCDYCCACGKPIPEGHQFCPDCLPYERVDKQEINEELMAWIVSERRAG